MSDEEINSLIKTYGNHNNEIKYLEFINDANPKKGYVAPEPIPGGKSTYSAIS